MEILGREEGRCGQTREDHAAVEGMEFKSYINTCWRYIICRGWILELPYFQVFLLLQCITYKSVLMKIDGNSAFQFLRDSQALKKKLIVNLISFLKKH